MSFNRDHDTTSSTEIQTLHKSLTSQATTLLSELSAFRQHLETQEPPYPVKPSTLLNKFQIDVQRELSHLLKYVEPDSDTHPQQDNPVNQESRDAHADLDGIHRIRSSNITFLADVWEGAKRSRGVVGIRKGVRYLPRDADVGVKMGRKGMVRHDEQQVEAESGVRGVSKKMNREARERAKRERQSQYYEPGETGETVRRVLDPDAAVDETGKTRGKVGNRRRNPARPRREKESITVDVIADHGATWIKMFTKNQRWLMMDLAKEGIVDVDDSSSGGGSEEEDRSRDEDGGSAVREDWHDKAMEELKLVKMVREFMAASRTTRVGMGHRHPKVCFCLPKINRGISRDVDRVLEFMVRVGVEVFTAEELHQMEQKDAHIVGGEGTEERENGSNKYASGLQGTFEAMASPSPSIQITDTLNVDCTVLIALISDVSHSRWSEVTIPEHYKGSARRDIEVQLQTDVEDPLLPNHIYPILRGRRLVCTKKAMEHWKNIVQIMGSPTEATRCKIFLGEADIDRSQGSSARDQLQKLSVHKVPDDLKLPFEVVNFDLDDIDINIKEDGSGCKRVEIDVMRELAKEPRLSSLNCSVFFHGWYKSLTTVSLNRVVSEWLSRAVNVVLDDLESRKRMTSDIAEATGFRGANALVCGRERSLLGSEK